jgi:hypothetical protein
MKWKQFLLTWLVVYLLAPSIWTHRLLMTTTPPPGSPEVSIPLFIPFGGITYTAHLWGELVRGDFGDALAIFLVLILPILIYTFFLSWLIHLGLRRIWRSRQSIA